MKLSDATFEFDSGITVRFRMAQHVIVVTIPNPGGEDSVVTIVNRPLHRNTKRLNLWPCESHARSAIKQATGGKSPAAKSASLAKKKFNNQGLRLIK
jgi:hypothetical protein